MPGLPRTDPLGRKLPITDTRMTRFLLSLNEAVTLVLHAAEDEVERTVSQGVCPRIDSWWEECQHAQIPGEYCSADGIADDGLVRKLIKQSDREFQELDMGGGEFALFGGNA